MRRQLMIRIIVANAENEAMFINTAEMLLGEVASP
jgi:hypothetical protein